MRRAQRRLHLHRETLRSLSAESLLRVAGGDLGGEINPAPRTNAWTAGDPIGYVIGNALCGVSR
jgi:hypothetical protein